MTDYLLVVLGIIMMILGIIGCLVPVLPGPPLSFVGLLMLHFTRFGHFTGWTLITFASISIAVLVLDYLVPVWGTRKFGGSKYGTRGAAIGLIIGLFLGPVGIILGPFIGAVVGEMIFRDDFNYAIKAGFGSLIGFLAGVGLKLAASLVMTFYFVRALIV